MLQIQSEFHLHKIQMVATFTTAQPPSAVQMTQTRYSNVTFAVKEWSFLALILKTMVQTALYFRSCTCCYKIIDFTRLLPGPMATYLLAQMGAEIIKIESPKRMDYMRDFNQGRLFQQLNHNKNQLLLQRRSPRSGALMCCTRHMAMSKWLQVPSCIS